MRKKNIISTTVLCLCVIVNTLAQVTYMELDKEISYPELSDSLKQHGAVFLCKNITYDMRYEEDNLVVYETEYQKVLINDEEAISNFNTYYVDDEVLDWIKMEARTIDSVGNIVNFDKNSVKEIVDEETGNKYKVYAIDGIKEGDVVEFITIKKDYFSSFGQFNYQSSYPVVDAVFAISCPDNLEFQFKAYNDPNSEFKTDTLNGIKNYKMTIKDIPVYKKESFSYSKPNKTRIEYRLDKNYYKGNHQIKTWDVAAANIYSFIYSITPKEKKALVKLLDEFKGETDNYEIIRKLEDKLKKEILTRESVGGDYSNINFLLSKKLASERGITKVYANALEILGIEHSIILTCSRSDYYFDKDFQNWNRLDEYMIYLPETKQYITPVYANIRMGNPSFDLTAQYALFVHKVKVGDYESAIADIKYIPPTSASDNYDHIYANLSLSEDFETVNVITERDFKGDAGAYIKYIIERLNEQERDKTLKGRSTLDGYNPDFNTIEVLDKSEHKTAEDADFAYRVDASVPDFVEFANDNVLLNIGNAIGEQSELYNDGEREHDLENYYNRTYYRELTFTVPDGYVVSNPEATVFDVIYEVDGDTIAAFVSTIDYENNNYKVTINEFYTKLIIKKENYEPFRKVINAAADFNKVVLILKPE